MEAAGLHRARLEGRRKGRLMSSQVKLSQVKRPADSTRLDSRGLTELDEAGRSLTWLDVAGCGWTWLDVAGRGWTELD